MPWVSYSTHRIFGLFWQWRAAHPGGDRATGYRFTEVAARAAARRWVRSVSAPAPESERTAAAADTG